MSDWRESFTLKQPLRQIDVEMFERHLAQQPAAALRATSGAVANGALLRAAIAAGWIERPACSYVAGDGNSVYLYDSKSVDALPPAAVRWLGQRIDAAYEAAMTAEPENL